MENHVRLHVGKDVKHVLVNKKTARNLRSFKLTTDPVLLTTYEWVGNGPRYEDPPDDIFSNESYPLRIDFGETADDVNIILLSRPLSMFKSIELDLHPERKDLIRFTMHVPLHQDVIDTLVSLGVEIDMPGEPLK
jgi:hypothetical protein